MEGELKSKLTALGFLYRDPVAGGPGEWRREYGTLTGADGQVSAKTSVRMRVISGEVPQVLVVRSDRRIDPTTRNIAVGAPDQSSFQPTVDAAVSVFRAMGLEEQYAEERDAQSWAARQFLQDREPLQASARVKGTVVATPNKDTSGNPETLVAIYSHPARGNRGFSVITRLNEKDPTKTWNWTVPDAMLYTVSPAEEAEARASQALLLQVMMRQR